MLTGRTETDTTSHSVPYSSNGQTRAWSYSYVTPGLPDSIDGPLPGTGDTVDYDYDLNGYLDKVTNEAGHVTDVTSVNGNGQPLTIVDPNGVASALAYDARGRLISVTVDPAAPATTSFAYDAAGQITRLTLPDGSFFDYAWNDAHRLISVSNAAGEKITYAYDAMGNRTAITTLSAAGGITRAQTQTFDELGRLLREIGAGAQTTLHAYDKVDNRVGSTDPRGKLYGFAFDALNRLTSETDPASAQIAYANDAADNLAAVTNARGHATAYVYNGWGEAIRETSPDRGVTDYVRNQLGNVTQQTDARGVVSVFSYDPLGRVLTRSFPSAPAETVAYAWDDSAGGNRGIGRLSQVNDASGSRALRYDGRGNLVAETRVIAGQSYVTAYAWDAADNLIQLSYPSGRIVSYARDALGRVASVSTKVNAAAAPVAVASGVSYIPFGPVSGLSFGNGVALSRSYDQDYRLTRIAAVGVSELTYSYDAAGNITAIREMPNPNFNQEFAYDDLNRLIWARGRYNINTYSYDLAGNRIGQSYAPGAAGVVNESHTIALSSNRLLSVSSAAGTRSLGYDAAGNVANDNRPGGVAYSYTHSAAGDLAAVMQGAAGLASYTHDARHLRAVKSVPGGAVPQTHYLYSPDGQLLAEHNGSSGGMLREIIWLPSDADEHLPLAQVSATLAGPALYAIHADHLGRPRKLSNAARAVVWDGYFAPFGEAHYLQASVAQNLRFPGQYADAETAFSYNWRRTYDPALGRYLQSDPIGLDGGINTYGYVNGNPLGYTDPTGECPWCVAGAVAGARAAAGELGAAGAMELQKQLQKLFNKANPPDAPADKAKEQAEGGKVCTPEDPKGGHKKGARPSTKGKHQKGRARAGDDYGGEKGDTQRRPPRKPPPGHTGPWPPKNSE